MIKAPDPRPWVAPDNMEDIRAKGERLATEPNILPFDFVNAELLESLRGVVIITHKPNHPPARILSGSSEGIEPASFPMYVTKEVVLDAEATPDCCKEGCRYAKDIAAPEYTCAGRFCFQYGDINDDPR